MAERKKILLRLDPAVHDALARWAGDELRSTNAQIEFLLRRALTDAGRMPGNSKGIARRGRPPKHAVEQDGQGEPEKPDEQARQAERDGQGEQDERTAAPDGDGRADRPDAGSAPDTQPPGAEPPSTA
ncbi:hypothetical protein GCM10027570_53360 [Streptomonospora sediminis]